jgi:methylthioribose-1-phosphate isomerase
MHAIAAHHHQIPFYTATSSHTIDFSLATGDGCPIEFRNQEEVKHIQGVPIALKETQALYPSFDITPNELIAGIITEKGVITAPYSQNLLVLNN